jgi:uncharacterized membrane protein YeiB
MTAAGGTIDAASRIPGIDLARFLAIAGMLAVHVGPMGLTDPAGRLYALLTHGRASILFGLLAGIGVSLLARSRSASLGETRLRLVWQAALLLPLGLWLQTLDVSIRVILSYYALLFVLGAVCIGLATRSLAALAAAALALGPVTFQLGRRVAPDTFDRAPVEWGDPTLEIAHGLLLSGPYPLITWAAPFLVGMLLGRADLRSRNLRLALVVGGCAVAVLAAAPSFLLGQVFAEPDARPDWLYLLDDRPHSQLPLWLIGSIGSALLVLGLSLVVADRLGKVVWPFVAAGQLALTIYVAHILAFHWFGETLRATELGEAVGTVTIGMAAAAVFAVLWRSLLPRGPLEFLMTLPALLMRWRRAGWEPREGPAEGTARSATHRRAEAGAGHLHGLRR